MTRKEMKENQKKRDELLYRIVNKGKVIAISTIWDKNVYSLLDNNVWYIPYGKHAINQGTLEEFNKKMENKMLKARFL